ncbi:MAG: helix-turn-helix domain-containing protein [Kastovskya adunca ATA6-11-RM4]|jgi:hypothetical protein|nr:helix-turn-helix domain-containing protein [Kastovskya adunca ATA6-11-RM4]
MPAPRFISLNKEEDSTLYELSVANGVPRRTKLRAVALRLNANGWAVPRIAAYLQQSQQTVRQTLQRWQNRGLAGLWEAPGRGKPIIDIFGREDVAEIASVPIKSEVVATGFAKAPQYRW